MTQDLLFATSDQLSFLSEGTQGLVYASYSFPSADLPTARKMAVQIASGQTLGYVPDPIQSFLNYMGRVASVACDAPSKRGSATIAFPAQLFGTDISGLLTVLFGKISFAPGIYLEAVAGDDRYMKQLTGSKFGLSGIRKLVGVAENRPLLMAILKPGIGPDDQKLAENFAKLTDAGTHLVKDDEVRVDATTDEAKRRLARVLEAGQGRGLYVMALNGPAFELRHRALELQAAGAQAFLVCPYTYGISVMQSLCEDADIRVPIFAHPSFTGIMSSGSNGIRPAVSLGTLMRWSGADAVLFPSPYGSIALPKSDAVAIHQALVRQEGALAAVASVPSAGILPEFVAQIRADFGVDVVVNAGTGMAKSGATIADGARAFLAEIERHFVGV